jgi:ubiquinone/menaquinone biosynthesis C-methylase UbiE
MNQATAQRISDQLQRAYNSIAPEFLASRQEMVWGELAEFSDRLQSGQRVLDLGCGTGRAYRLVAGKAIEYQGLDNAAALIKLAKDHNRDLLADFRVGSMRQLPFPDASFDAVLAIASLHHVPSAAWRRQTLREVERVLRPGGTLLMTNWDLWQPRRRRWLWQSLPGKLWGGSGLDWNDVYVPWRHGDEVITERYYHAFTLGELRRLCQQAGLEVISNRRATQERRGGDRNLVTVAERPAS